VILNELVGKTLVLMAQRGFREPITEPRGADDVTGLPTFIWNPPLTAQEQADFDILVGIARSGMTSLSIAEYQTVRQNLQPLRALRQLTQSQFIALTQNQRDRMLYDALVGDTVLWLLLLRE
jgi:hypothetical protein